MACFESHVCLGGGTRMSSFVGVSDEARGEMVRSCNDNATPLHRICFIVGIGHKTKKWFNCLARSVGDSVGNPRIPDSVDYFKSALRIPSGRFSMFMIYVCFGVLFVITSVPQPFRCRKVQD